MESTKQSETKDNRSNSNNGSEKTKDNTESQNDVDYDHLLTCAGEFGRYQWFLFLSTCPFYIFGAFVYFQQLFITEVSPNHWCWIPELENLSAIERRSLSAPLDPDGPFGYSQCTQYVTNWTDVLATGAKPDQSWTTQVCQHGWEFNKSEIPYQTISSELGWVCNKDSYQATAQSLFFVGSIVGGITIGWISDRYGRLPATVISNVIACLFGIISIFAKNFLVFGICRFLMGMSYDNCFMMIYLIVLEYIAPKYRTMAANMPFAIFFTLGCTSLPWIALACNDWRILSIATSVPLALALLTPLILPESPRWLLSRGRIDDAVNKVVKISKVNKKEVPSSLLQEFTKCASNKVENKTSILEVMKRPKLRKVFICMCLLYMCCMTVFDALVRSIGGLGFDFFLSFTLVSLTEFPSIILMSLIVDHMGRKCLSITALLVCGVFSIVTAFIGGGLPSVICSVLARFFVNIACNITMQWAAEVLPTPVRGNGASIVHICSYIATFISPYIVYIQNYVTWLPLVIIGCVAFAGAACTLVIPETARKGMPQTFEDSEILIEQSNGIELPCLAKKQIDTNVGHVNASFEMK